MACGCSAAANSLEAQILRRNQALRRLKKRAAKLGRASGWDAPARRGSILAKLADEGETVRETLFRLVVAGEEVDRHGEPTGEPELDPAGIELLAAHLEIPAKKGTRNVKWEPYEEQKLCWRDLCEERWVYDLKSRQIGITTAILLFDALWTAVRDARGDTVTCALLWDRLAKARPQVRQAASFIDQLGIPLRKDPTLDMITFPGGSFIEARSANSQGATRGLAYSRFHCSEMPFWGQGSAIWAAMQPSLNLRASLTFESTMELAADPFAANMWRKPNKFFKRFFPFELHRNYKADPSLIPDEKWAWLRDDEGFTDRSAAAWWWDTCQEERDGKIQEMFREYPQEIRHAFAHSAGRFLKVEPKVTRPVEVIHWTSADDDTQHFDVEIFRIPEDTSGQLVQGVDTAGANGGDKSVMVLVDKADMAVVACVASEWLGPDDLVDITAHVQNLYQEEVDYRRRNLGQRWLPPVVAEVEVNGPLGSSTLRGLSAAGARANPYDTGKKRCGTRDETLSEARRHIEAGKVFGPKVLADEAGELKKLQRADGTDGGWRGHDDFVMAYGMAARHIRRHPFEEAPTAEAIGEQTAAQFVAAIRREEAAAGRGRGL